MQKQKIICFVLPVLLFASEIAMAKISYINDYQKKEIYGKRKNDPTSNNDISKEDMIPDSDPISVICANHDPAYKARADLGQDYICKEWDYGAVTCCKVWTCDDSIYLYDSCANGKTLTNTCTGNDGVTRGKSCS